MSLRTQLGYGLVALTLALGMTSGSACQKETPRLKRPNLASPTPDGGLYVSDFHHQRVVLFDSGGRFVRSFGRQGLAPGTFWQVWGLALGADGTEYVVNQRLHDLQASEKFTEVVVLREGQELRRFALPSDAGEHIYSDVVVAPDGHLVLVDESRNELAHFSPTGELLQRWKTPRGGAPFETLRGVGIGDGSYWTVEESTHRIRRLDAEGTQRLVFGEEGSAPGQLRFPSSVAVCPQQGWVAVGDLGNFRVQRFDLEGRYLDGFSPPPLGPNSPVQILDVRVSTRCDRLYVIDSKGNRVLVTSPRGEVLQTLSSW